MLDFPGFHSICYQDANANSVVNDQMEELEDFGLIDDSVTPEGMREKVTRKTARNPNARSTPNLRQLDEQPYHISELRSMTVVELKHLLGEAGLRKNGRKSELIARLKEAGW